MTRLLLVSLTTNLTQKMNSLATKATPLPIMVMMANATLMASPLVMALGMAPMILWDAVSQGMEMYILL